MLFYPRVMISRTRSWRLTPTGATRNAIIDYSNGPGSDVDFSVFRAQNVPIRTPYDRHRFAGGTLGWIETADFSTAGLRFFAGGDRYSWLQIQIYRLKYANGDLKGPRS